MSTDAAPQPLDLDALRERYAQERDRRVAADPSQRQYRDVEQGFAHLLDDPYGSAPPREAIKDEVDVFIVGGGFGGLLTGARLREAGVARIRIADAGSDFGGTWYWNRYPGAACDIESYIYFPLLEETGYMPTERYSKAEEIRLHCRRIAERYDLYRDALFSTQVKGLAWDGATARWTVTTDRGDEVRARFVVLTTGPLNRPKLPDIPGIETFAGHSFHTSRWDYGYTGGTATEPMTGLTGKRVGVIGTGATAIQCVPPLARDAAHLTVFQRTPSGVDPRDNSRTDPAWWASLPLGWQKERTENFSAQFTQALPPHDLVADGWTVMARAMRAKVAGAGPGADYGALHDLADFEKMQMTRDRVDAIVEDRATAEALKPWYSVYCKRPCFSDQYLQAFNQPNVTLVQTGRAGVEQITPAGAVVEGVEYPLDCLIFATGFDTASSYAKRSGGMTITGVAGTALNEKWADGPATLHGMHTRGFPNCFVLSQVQAGMSPNFPHMISEQALHIAHIVERCLEKGIGAVEPTEAAEAEWVDTIVQGAVTRRKILEDCTPGYYNNEGRPAAAAAKSGVFAAGPLAFASLLRKWRDGGDFAGLEVDGDNARTDRAPTPEEPSMTKSNGRRSIFITGAASGMGRETALLFASKGWFVGAYDVNRAGLDALEAEVGVENGMFETLDVTDVVAFEAAVAGFGAATGGTLDLLFNNAGIAKGGLFDEQPWDEVMSVVSIKFIGVMIGVRAGVKLLRATPGSLCLINSSSSAIFGTAGAAIYSATKHAVRGLTEALSIEFKRYGVRAADLLPGLIDTPLMGDQLRAMAPPDGMWRLVHPREIAEVVWRAYHEDKLHWYVPQELREFHRQVIDQPEAVREERTALLAMMAPPAEA